jgi:hypothetical protein
MCKNKQNVTEQKPPVEELKSCITNEINNKRLYNLSDFDCCLDDAFNRSVKIYEQTLRYKT